MGNRSRHRTLEEEREIGQPCSLQTAVVSNVSEGYGYDQIYFVIRILSFYDLIAFISNTSDIKQ